MIQPASSIDSRLGFITVVETPDQGFSGGLLIVNTNGRPLEFHCTAAVKINRAQSILYGRTYRSFLFCEQIASSLIEKARTQPCAYLTDTIDLLPLYESVETPVLLVPEIPDAAATNERATAPKLSERLDLQSFELNERRFWFDVTRQEQAAPLRSVCERFCQTLPIDEPLERIREAISEAQAVAR